jgi:hypothetical protein
LINCFLVIRAKKHHPYHDRERQSGVPSHHSREGGNPVLSLVIPAKAGIQCLFKIIEDSGYRYASQG